MLKRTFLILGLMTLSLRVSDASPSLPDLREVDSTWPDVKMQVLEVDRIDGNRLVVVIRLLASPNARGATLIGEPPVVPPTATPEEKKMGFGPGPFSLEGSTMIDERTQEKYAMLTPDKAASGYRPSVIMTTLLPREATIMTVQFPMPPPPLPDDKGIVPQQTVSILLPKAKGPITKIVIPPSKPATPGQ